MGCCFSCLGNRSICCVRLSLIILCLIVCIGPLLILIGIGLYFVPQYVTQFTPSVYEYNVNAAAFQTRFRTQIDSISVEASSAVPLLGSLGIYHDLTKDSRTPPIDGVRLGVANVMSISHFGEVGGILGAITGFYKFRLTGGSIARNLILSVNAPVKSARTLPIVCTWSDLCTDISLDFCPEGFTTYTGNNQCRRDETCGTCQGELYLLQLCMLIIIGGGLYTTSNEQGCFYPFTSPGDYASPTVLKEIPVQVLHVYDPYIALQKITKGTNDLGVQYVLLSILQDVGAGISILGGGIVIITILLLCTVFYSQSGRRGAQRTWEKFLGVRQPEDFYPKPSKQPVVDNTGAIPSPSHAPTVGGQNPIQPNPNFHPVLQNPIQTNQQPGYSSPAPSAYYQQPFSPHQHQMQPISPRQQSQPMYPPQAQYYAPQGQGIPNQGVQLSPIGAARHPGF